MLMYNRVHTRAGVLNLCWRPYTTYPDRLVYVGIWYATKPDSTSVAFATTTGAVGFAFEWQHIDMERHDGWPLIFDTSTHVASELRIRAMTNLKTFLDEHAHEWPEEPKGARR